MKDLYQAVGVDPYSLSHARMGGQIDKEIFKKRIVKYVRRKARVGDYPTYKEIQKGSNVYLRHSSKEASEKFMN